MPLIEYRDSIVPDDEVMRVDSTESEPAHMVWFAIQNQEFHCDVFLSRGDVAKLHAQLGEWLQKQIVCKVCNDTKIEECDGRHPCTACVK